MPNRTTGQVEKQITVEQYFQKRYNVFLEYPDLPLIEVGKKGTMYPMEICHMGKGQKYPYKLDEVQVRTSLGRLFPCLTNTTDFCNDQVRRIETRSS